MLKNFFAWSAVVAALYVLQTSFLPLFSYHGVSPDLLLLFVVSFGFVRGKRLGVFAGFLGGLLIDAASGTFFGMNILTKMIAGYVSGALSDRVFKEQTLLPVLSSVVATIVNYFILAVLMLLLGYRYHVLFNAQAVLFSLVVFQLVFAYPVHKLVCEVNLRLSREEQKAGIL